MGLPDQQLLHNTKQALKQYARDHTRDEAKAIMVKCGASDVIGSLGNSDRTVHKAILNTIYGKRK